MKKCCLECSWAVSAEEGYTKEERSSRAVEHFLRTGHEIETVPESIRFRDPS